MASMILTKQDKEFLLIALRQLRFARGYFRQEIAEGKQSQFDNIELADNCIAFAQTKLREVLARHKAFEMKRNGQA